MDHCGEHFPKEQKPINKRAHNASYTPRTQIALAHVAKQTHINIRARNKHYVRPQALDGSQSDNDTYL